MKKLDKKDKIIWSVIVFLFVYVSVNLIWAPRYFRVYGPSMFPSFRNGDYCIGLRHMGTLERGDVVSFYHNGDFLIKRIIGLPGEEIVISGNLVFINGKEDPTKEIIFPNDKVGNINVSKLGFDEYWVMGDNRPISFDSRFIGPVARKNMFCKVILKWHSFNPSSYYGY